ncbi:unnamed protein product [Durusdinium trenchii]|uniref:Pentatricopeptide repeat-containing protein, chloroplastic n=1 Tax=Durusdinium trenchii TaxID=1381693 RepID=A0ABP0PNQ1_9DINO
MHLPAGPGIQAPFVPHLAALQVVFCASVLSACEKGPRWEIGIELLDWMRSSLDLPLNLFCFGAAISACRKGSNWQGAWALLEDIWSSALQPDLVAFNATISSCEKAQRWEFAIELLEMMSLQQVPPDVVSFNATASACEKRAQWSWALWVFSQLKRTIPVEKQKGALLNISNACVSACAKATFAETGQLPRHCAGKKLYSWGSRSIDQIRSPTMVYCVPAAPPVAAAGPCCCSS